MALIISGTTLTLEDVPSSWVKQSVIAATTTNITLSGTQTIDGIALSVGDRVLVKDQTASQENGIYVVSASTWSRSFDANTASEIAGAQVAVSSGTTNGGTTWDTNFKSSDTLDTTAMTWNAVVISAGPTLSPDVVISGSSSGSALRITQTGAGNALLVEDSANVDSTPFVIQGTGRVGIGTTTPDATSKLNIGGTSLVAVSPFANAVFVNPSIPTNVSLLYNSFRSEPTTDASVGLAQLNHFYAADATLGSGAALTNQMGFLASAAITAATNNYGFYSDIASATGRWNFYAAGTAPNYFAGDTTFNAGLAVNGTVSGTGFSTYLASPPAIGGTAPAAGSFTNLNATGVAVFNGAIASAIGGAEISLIGTLPTTGSSAAYGFWSDVTLPSNATGASIGISSRVSTAAASFTAGTISAFASNFTTLGAGSSVTNLFGFNAQTGLTTATSINAGYYSQIAAGANRWNLYISGTANNLIQGSIGIGGVPADNAKLHVAGMLPSNSAPAGIAVTANIPSAGIGQTNVFATYVGTEAASFTANQLFHFHASQGSIGAGSAITQQIGLYIATTLTGATTNYGVFSDIAASGTARWNFYAGGTAPNYFAGPLGIGATTTGDPLRIAGTINHATFSNAQIIDATIGSSVTSSFRGVMSRPITQNATFTLSNLIHFYVNPQTKGASSTITNQYGFFAESSITDATTNFGFYSNIAAASQRWNFYAAGTAANYFAGNTFIGATTGDQALNVNGAVRVAAATSTNQTSAATFDFTGGAGRFLVWGASGVQGNFSWWTGSGALGAAQRMALSGTTLTLGVAGSTTGALACTGSTSGTVTITPAAAAGTWTLTLPTSAGTNGYVLSTDGAGVTSWVAQSGGGGSGISLAEARKAVSLRL